MLESNVKSMLDLPNGDMVLLLLEKYGSQEENIYVQIYVVQELVAPSELIHENNSFAMKYWELHMNTNKNFWIRGLL